MARGHAGCLHLRTKEKLSLPVAARSRDPPRRTWFDCRSLVGDSPRIELRHGQPGGAGDGSPGPGNAVPDLREDSNKTLSAVRRIDQVLISRLPLRKSLWPPPTTSRYRRGPGGPRRRSALTYSTMCASLQRAVNAKRTTTSSVTMTSVQSGYCVLPRKPS